MDHVPTADIPAKVLAIVERAREADDDEARQLLGSARALLARAARPKDDEDVAGSIDRIESIAERIAEADINTWPDIITGRPVLVAPDFDAREERMIIGRPRVTRTGDNVSPFLVEGEVAMLSGPGGVGKSTVALALAAAASWGDGPYGERCGLAVRRGNVLVISYEDSASRVARRLAWYGTRNRWRHLQLADRPGPLWQTDTETRLSSGTAYFERLKRATIEASPVLIVIDPVAVAFAGAHPSDATAVRAFLLALTDLAKTAAAGVLLLAHDTKSGRRAVRAGEEPGPDAIAGSSQWFDGVRSAIHLARYPGYPDAALLTCIKNNYGPTGWATELISDPERWRGWEAGQSLPNALAVKRYITEGVRRARA